MLELLCSVFQLFNSYVISNTLAKKKKTRLIDAHDMYVFLLDVILQCKSLIFLTLLFDI